MIQNDFGQVTVAPERLGWEAHHDEGRFGGPEELLVDGVPVAQVDSFYIDDMTQDTVAVERVRAFRKLGAGVVQHEGVLPFGNPIQVGQTCRYAANHVRVTFDINWPRDAVVNRHFGVGSLFLPGRWTRYYSIPPCNHLAEGVAPAWHQIPATPPGSGMLGHWHRPPLALVFEREDGFRLEVGTGNDVWRWEHCLGFGPEAGSYKILHEGDGLRFVREPLMTCEPVQPEKRQYRMSWYLAWQRPGETAQRVPAGDVLDLANAAPAAIRTHEGGVFRLDPGQLGLPETCLRVTTPEAFIRGDTPTDPCWESNGTQKALRRLIRPLIALGAPGTLVVGPMVPEACWVPSHFDRKHARGLAHWDLCSLLDFAVWVRQRLGLEWTIIPDSAATNVSPAMAGLFGETGFAKDEDLLE
jgi:hypothetical protein